MKLSVWFDFIKIDKDLIFPLDKYGSEFTMATVKEAVIELIQQLPDDISMDELMYHLYAKEKIMRGKRQIAEGKVKSHEEVIKKRSKN
jgi:hypothetical protein